MFLKVLSFTDKESTLVQRNSPSSRLSVLRILTQIQISTMQNSYAIFYTRKYKIL